MRAGELRHRVIIEEPTEGTPNAYGERVPTWREWDTRWARVEPVSGREVAYAKTHAATVSHKITLRYVEGLLPTFRVRYGVLVFTIDAAIDVEMRRKELNLFCTQVIE
jgi:SPP1 family predicted phage head-tail adaptor